MVAVLALGLDRPFLPWLGRHDGVLLLSGILRASVPPGARNHAQGVENLAPPPQGARPSSGFTGGRAMWPGLRQERSGRTKVRPIALNPSNFPRCNSIGTQGWLRVKDSDPHPRSSKPRVLPVTPTLKGSGSRTRTYNLDAQNVLRYQLRHSRMVRMVGLEPTTPSPPDWCATKLRHILMVSE